MKTTIAVIYYIGFFVTGCMFMSDRMVLYIKRHKFQHVNVPMCLTFFAAIWPLIWVASIMFYLRQNSRRKP